MVKNQLKFEINWKQKAKENVTLKMQQLFGVIRDIYHRIRGSESPSYISAAGATEMTENYQLKAEQEKAEILESLSRRDQTLQ